MQNLHEAPDFNLVIFGASGDLTSRKIIPAISSLAADGLITRKSAILGVARTEMDDETFRALLKEKSVASSPVMDEIISNSRYVTGDYADKNTFSKLRETLLELESVTGKNVLFYLATVPEVFTLIARNLAEEKLNTQAEGAASRIVIEKPFGRDLASAISLDEELKSHFAENQIFRIDHYMGKENVQNLLALRFANAIFEPVWNRRYIDSIQITVAETLGVEHRGGFYESEGALRDIVQNHVMQVLALTLMEPPALMDAEGIRDEKVRLLKSVVIDSADQVAKKVVRGQYGKGIINGEVVIPYREEDGVNRESKTETYVALKLEVDSWRWSGVPIYVRTGKRLKMRTTEVVMQFQKVPHLAFQNQLAKELKPNLLVLKIQPDEGISLFFGAKKPGPRFELLNVSMDFSYEKVFNAPNKDAYERLLLDAMLGDPTLFIRTDEVRQAWKIVDPILQAFSENKIELHSYEAGTWGPKQADMLLEAEGRYWHNP